MCLEGTHGPSENSIELWGKTVVETGARLWEGTDEAGLDLFGSSGVCGCVCV